MNILVVSSFLPYPLFSGGHVRLFNILKELSKRHEITLVCEKRKHQTQSDIKAVQAICKEIYVVERKNQWSPDVIFHTAISSYPFLLKGHELPEMKKILEKLLSEKQFDVVHVETFYVYHNLPETVIPVVLTEHNIEYSVYSRFAKTAPLLLRPFLQIDIEKIMYWEKSFWKKAAKVVAVSQIEADQIRKDAVVVANGVNLVDFPFISQKNNTEKTVLFMGDFKWIQNIATAKWILEEIWPKIESPNLKLWIVGKHIPDSLKRFSSEHIIFDEQAPDKTSDIYKKADILLSPIKVGGGTSYKILEAMASGVPVVTTMLGIEGLQAQHRKHVLTGETSDVLADHVRKLLADKKQYALLAKNARKFIEDKFTWVKITKVLEGVYEDAIKK